jgi:hypothetical protein
LGWGAAQENPPDGRSRRPRSPEKQIPLGRSDSNYRAAGARALKKRALGRSWWWPKAGENDRTSPRTRELLEWRMVPDSGNRQSAKFMERPGTPQARIGYRLRAQVRLRVAVPRVATSLEHRSALTVARTTGRVEAFAFRNSTRPCASAAPPRREGSRPLERRNLTSTRAGSFRNG